MVTALVVTSQGFPLAYEVMPGNTSARMTLAGFLKRIEAQYGRSDRTWIMYRGIPTEETLASMRVSDPPVQYLVGTPKGRLTKTPNLGNFASALLGKFQSALTPRRRSHSQCGAAG